MNNEIHYDDDIFYITLVLQTIRKACSLEIDPEFFLDKIMEDILFSDKVLKSVMSSLNKSFINIGQEIRNLYLAKRDLVIILEDIRNDTLPFSKHLTQYNTRFLQIIQSQKTDMHTLDELLNHDIQQSDKKNMISSDEYQVLFDDEE